MGQMTRAADPGWISFEEAFAAFEARLGLPHGLFPRPTDPLTCQEGSMMWLKDHAILVQKTAEGFGFDRSEFEAILKDVEPINPGGA